MDGLVSTLSSTGGRESGRMGPKTKLELLKESNWVERERAKEGLRERRTKGD